MTCSNCNNNIPCAAEEWPGESGGTICQVCWEKECGRSWWEAAIALDMLGLYGQEAQG